MIEKGVVNILDSSRASTGTGFFVRPDIIITCGHVIYGKNHNASATNQKKDVYYRSYDGRTHKSEILASIPINYLVEGQQESLVLLKAENSSDTYFRFCKRKIEGSIVCSFGYPLGSSEQKPASDIKIEGQNDTSLFLGKSNSIALGYSGGPVLYKNHDISSKPVAVGMVGKIFTDKKNNRLLV